MSDYFRVATIIKPHGVHGEVTVYPTCDDINRFRSLKRAFIDFNGEKKEVTCEGMKPLKDMVILKFSQIHDMNEAEGYRNHDILVLREDAVKPSENEFYVSDMYGAKIINEQLQEIGGFKDIVQYAAGKLLVITDKKGREIYIPYVDEYIKNIDKENMTFTIHVVPGLLD